MGTRGATLLAALPLYLEIRNRAGNGTRTRDPQLGKLMLYQLSYSRLRRGDSGSRTHDLLHAMQAL